jgi:hypothetical protein
MNDESIGKVFFEIAETKIILLWTKQKLAKAGDN